MSEDRPDPDLRQDLRELGRDLRGDLCEIALKLAAMVAVVAAGAAIGYLVDADDGAVAGGLVGLLAVAAVLVLTELAGYAAALVFAVVWVGRRVARRFGAGSDRRADR